MEKIGKIGKNNSFPF